MSLYKNRPSGLALPRFAIFVLRLLLHFIVFAGCCTFLAWVFMWISDDYDTYVGEFGSDTFGLSLKNSVFKSTILLYGYDLIFMTYSWVTILAAIIAAAGLYSLPKSDGYRSRELSLKAKSVMTWELPGHKFWLWWCGGLNVADIFVVALYLAMHGYWFAQYVKSNEVYLDALNDTGLALPFALPLLRLEQYAFLFGVLLRPSLFLLFFPLPHVSFLTQWLGVHYAKMIRWHRWIGQGTLWVLSLHGLLYYIYWGCINDFWHQFSDWGTLSSINYLAGSIAWFFGIALWATSIEFVRRRFFEVFYRTHIVCFLMFVVFSVMHYSWAWTMFTPGLLVYAIDIVIRAGQAAQATTIQATYVMDRDHLATLEIKLAKNFKAAPNQEVFIQIPQISVWQWHPFTIFKLVELDDGCKCMTLHCKRYNVWTTELCERGKLHQQLAARVAGPLGAGRNHAEWKDYSTVILVGGGIGALPVLASLRDIIEAAGGTSQPGSAGSPPPGLKKVVFVWVTRFGDEFSLLDEILLSAIQSCKWLEVSFYVTHQPLLKAKGSDEDSPRYSSGDSDAEKGVVKPMGGTLRWMPLTHHWASPWRLSASRPAQPRLQGFFLEASVACMVFLGAFFGSLLGSAYMADRHYTGEDSANSFWWLDSLTLFCCQLVMSLGLPYALVVLPVNFFNAFQHKLCMKATPPPAVVSPGAKNSPSSKSCHVALAEIMESVPPIKMGRPDMRSIFTAAFQGDTGDIGVFAGGPHTLRASANNLTYSLGMRWKLRGRHVHFHDESHEL